MFLEFHNLAYKIACVPSEDLDQHVLLHSLISLHCPPEDTLDTWLPTEHRAKTDQTVWMRWLICVFAGRTCSKTESINP